MRQVECPSGLVVRVRKLQGAEANKLASEDAAQRGDVFDAVLRGCTLELVDPGPYSFDSAVSWPDVLTCDRFVTLTMIRIATHGTKYEYEFQCGHSAKTIGRGCGHVFPWTFDIVEDFPLYDLPDESRDKIAAGDNRFEALCGDKIVVFKLLTGRDEARAAKRMPENRDRIVTYSLAQRIVEVDGVDRLKIGEWIDAVGFDEQLQLLDEFEDVDGGIDQEVEVKCPACGAVLRYEVPFEGSAYWLPRRSASKKRRQREQRRIMDARTPRTSRD